MNYSDADRERWADDHWDYQEQIGALEEDPRDLDYDPTPDDYYDCPVEEV